MEASQLRAVLLVVPALLAGCASHMANQTGAPTAARPAAATAAAASAPPPPALNTSVPPETMYQVLVAEVAMQRGQYDVAIKHYLELARETKDKRLAERAARVADYAHDDERALDAAKLWVEFDPASPEARQVLTAFFIRNGQLVEAQHQLEAVLAEVPADDDRAVLLIAS